MPDLQKGYTFSGTSPNNSVTAEKLNTLVDGATILTSFYTGQAELSSAAGADLALIFEAASGAFRKVRIANLIPTTRAKTGFTNLRAGTTSPQVVTASADELLLRSDAGQLQYVAGFTGSADLSLYSGGSTAGGRDAAAIVSAGTQWYYFWAIGDGSQARLLLSQSATSPTLPAGFAYQRLLGAVRIDHDGDFVSFSQRDREVSLDLASAAGVSDAVLNPFTGASPVEFTNIAAATARTLQTTDLSRCVPPNLVASVRGLIGSTDTSTAYQYALCPEGTSSLAAAPTETLEGLQMVPTVGFAAGATLLGFGNVASFQVAVKTSQRMSWACQSNAEAKHSLRITGYILSI